MSSGAYAGSNYNGRIVSRDETPGLGPGTGRDLLLQLGPIYFALIWNWMLLGTLIVQTYYYHLSFKRDSKWLKGLVYTILVFDLAQAGLSAHTSFYTFVLYYGNPLILQTPNPTILGLPLFGGLVGGAVQLFYAWRIWTLARWAYKSYWLRGYVGVVVCTSLVSTISAITFAFIFLKIQTQAGLYATVAVRLYATWYAAGFAVDVLIALAMVIIVTNAKTNNSFRKTNDLLTKVLIRIVATGVVNAVANGLGVVFINVWPAYDLSEVPAYIGGKLYSNMMLVSLNSRYTDAETTYAQGGVSVSVSTTDISSSAPTNSQPGRPGPGTGKLAKLQFTPNYKLRGAGGLGATSTQTSTSGIRTGFGTDYMMWNEDEIKNPSLQPGGEDIQLQEFERKTRGGEFRKG